MVPAAQLAVLVAQAEAPVAQGEVQAVQVAQVVQVVPEEADLVSIWEVILGVVEQMGDSRGTCPQYLMGTVPKATSFCRNSAS